MLFRSPSREYYQIANDILAYYKINNDFNIADFISYEVTSPYYETVIRIINDNEALEPCYDEFDDSLSLIKKWIQEEQINNLKIEIDNETDIHKRLELNDLLIKLKKESE